MCSKLINKKKSLGDQRFFYYFLLINYVFGVTGVGADDAFGTPN